MFFEDNSAVLSQTEKENNNYVKYTTQNKDMFAVLFYLIYYTFSHLEMLLFGIKCFMFSS